MVLILWNSKIGGGIKTNIEKWTVPKSRGAISQWVPTFKEAVPPGVGGLVVVGGGGGLEIGR